MLTAKKETVFTVHYSELENFIKAETGQTYEIPDQEGVDNDTVKQFKVVSGLEGCEKEVVENHLAGNHPSWGLRFIMNYLCSQGKLEAGKYIIDISW